MKIAAIVGLVQRRLPDLLAVHAFGSRAQGTAGPDSDLDLAVADPKKTRSGYAAAGERFATDYTRQDAAVLNIQRTCEAAIDMGQHMVRVLETRLDHFTVFSSRMLRSN